MKLSKFYLQLLVPLYLLFPIQRWLAHQHVDHFFLGLSSSFWAGVTRGVFIICSAAFVALVVFQIHAIRSASPGNTQ